MESIEQPFDNITRIGADMLDTNDKAGLIETKGRSKQLFNGDSPRAESSPLHQAKGTNSILHGPQNRGLRIIIISAVVFAIAVTVALILTIYLEPKQVHGHAAVSCEDVRCSEIGLQILQAGGGAVDAAIAAAFCLGVVNPAHSGVGGGGFAIVHDHKVKKSLGYNFREMAPLTDWSTQGSNVVGVPGLVKGLAQLHEAHGKLLWKDLLQPAIDLASSGFTVSQELARVFQITNIDIFKKSPAGQIFLNGNSYKDVNESIVWPALANTLRKIQANRDSLYSGGLMEQFIQECQRLALPLTEDDMKNYTVRQQEALKTKFKELTVVSMPPPASGSLVALMLNMIDKLDWKDYHKNDNMTYHQLIEVFKFAYAQTSQLGDPVFNPSMENITTHLISQEFAANLVKKINDNHTFTDDAEYGDRFYPSRSSGMSHISVIDSSELMISVTLGINSHFGSKLYLPETGVWLNNALEDFTLNELEPGKRPVSSMSPTVLYNDEHPCAHRLIIGASNGEKILTGIVQSIVNSVIFKMNLEDAIAAPRIHDQLVPNETLVEAGAMDVKNFLLQKGHNVKEWSVSEESSVVMGIEKTNDNIRAYSDLRKFGRAAQY